MITKTAISQNLKFMDRQFGLAASPREQIYLSKLAVLELCGWIEESIDDLVFRATKGRVQLDANIKYFEKTIVKRNSGFSYDSHFRYLLSAAVGLNTFDETERKVDQAIRAQFISQLQSLYTVRNSLAHTYVKGTTFSIEAPSLTKSRFPYIYVGLKAYEKKVFELI